MPIETILTKGYPMNSFRLEGSPSPLGPPSVQKDWKQEFANFVDNSLSKGVTAPHHQASTEVHGVQRHPSNLGSELFAVKGGLNKNKGDDFGDVELGVLNKTSEIPKQKREPAKLPDKSSPEPQNQAPKSTAIPPPPPLPARAINKAKPPPLPVRKENPEQTKLIDRFRNADGNTFSIKDTKTHQSTTPQDPPVLKPSRVSVPSKTQSTKQTEESSSSTNKSASNTRVQDLSKDLLASIAAPKGLSNPENLKSRFEKTLGSVAKKAPASLKKPPPEIQQTKVPKDVSGAPRRPRAPDPTKIE